jgi:hypothetical protein
MKLCASIVWAVLCKLNEAFDLFEKKKKLVHLGGKSEECLPGLRFGDGM